MNFLKDLARKVTRIVNGNAFAKVESMEGNQMTTVYNIAKDGRVAEASRLNKDVKLSAVPVSVNRTNK